LVVGEVFESSCLLYAPSSWKQSCRSVARLRLARKPKLRMRTKPAAAGEQKAAQKLFDIQGHEPFLVAVAESRQRKVTLFLESDQPGVRDGDAMGVGTEITQHMFWPPKAVWSKRPSRGEQQPQQAAKARAGPEAASCRGTGVHLAGRRREVRRRTCRGRHGSVRRWAGRRNAGRRSS